MGTGTVDLGAISAPLDDARAQLRQAIDILGYDDSVYDIRIETVSGAVRVRVVDLASGLLRVPSPRG